jgi:hypothetical protein
VYYFEQFPNLYYTFDKDLQQFYVLKNIFTRVDVISSVLTNALVYYEYSWQDGDTLESIAFKFYGDPLRHWIIIFANTMIDPYFDLPLNANDFANNIIQFYGSIDNAQSQLAVIKQFETVTTTIGGSSNTITYATTVTNNPFTYNFNTKQVVGRTLPTLADPIIDVSNVTVVTEDGATVQTVTTLNAVSAYDNEVDINEAKRNIVLIDASYAPQIEAQFQQLLGT